MRSFIFSLILLGCPSITFACPVCYISGHANSRAAYLGATLFMILAVATLLALVGAAIYKLTKGPSR